MDGLNNNRGSLRFYVTGKNYLPIKNATIEISNTGEPDTVIAVLTTDENGNSDEVILDTPPIAYGMEPTDNQPYSIYNAKIRAEDYSDIIIAGIQLMPNRRFLQSISLDLAVGTSKVYNPVVIDAHTLWEYYPPKIAEAEVKPVNESGEIVLSRVVIPETIIVHDGVPTDSTAKDYYIPYIDYIKNVACCEIYSTWPDETIKANILAIMSFTLNRVYTEWYRNKGYSFTITSSTAFDHKWIYGKAISDNISKTADDLYQSYLSRPNVKQPILTQYCDGKRVSCPNWMTQWGSKYLGDDGLSAAEILRYFYGNDIYINTAEVISGIPASYPGYELSVGSSGAPVLEIQEQLVRISKSYPAIPVINPDGIYGAQTKNAVETFQNIFGLTKTGVVDYRTWYKISQIYVGVTKIAENV